MSGIGAATVFIYYIETWRGEGGRVLSELEFALVVRLQDREWISF
jgi:hypothetical protein